MGILNINQDSFYDDSRFNSNDAIKKIKELCDLNTDIIDIGAVSSKPGSIKVDPQDELNRIKTLIDEIYNQKLYNKTTFSIDSYEPIVEYALKKVSK